MSFRRAAWSSFATVLLIAVSSVARAGDQNFKVVDTGQITCHGDRGWIAWPKPGEAFFGQDAQYAGRSPSYRDNGDGTVSDLHTGLTWQKTPDFVTRGWDDAVKYSESLEVAGKADWRLPTIKELFSIADFRGSMRSRTPYIDTRYFDFKYPDTSTGARDIDAQYWSSNRYLGSTMRGDESAFGFNFADGRIKSYPVRIGGRGGRPADDHRGRKYVRCVRGKAYGVNDFVDNRDGTVTDRATGLIWAKADSLKPMTWQDALAHAEGLELADRSDWRLPNVKELQSIVDYGRAPDAKRAADRGPAIDPVFELTEAESWCWTSTTHIENGYGYYVCFGQGFSAWIHDGKKMNAHGAGAVRSDPKSGDPASFAEGHGPQGDEIRILNYVRCVRGGQADRVAEAPEGASRPTGGERPPRGEGQPPERPSGKQFVARLDRDGDGRVSAEEFDGPARHFRHLDRNGDGYLTEEEAPRGPPPGREGPRRR